MAQIRADPDGLSAGARHGATIAGELTATRGGLDANLAAAAAAYALTDEQAIDP